MATWGTDCPSARLTISSLAVVPQEDVQDHVVVARVEVVAVGGPAGGEAVQLDVAAPPRAVADGKGGLPEIGAGVHVPPAGGMHRNRAAVQGAKPRRAPARVVPETVQQLFRNQALPVERRFGDPAVVEPQAVLRGAGGEAAALDFHRGTP